MIQKWTDERDELYDEIHRLESLSTERLKEIEKKSHNSGKLMIKLALAYAELERNINAKELS